MTASLEDLFQAVEAALALAPRPAAPAPVADDAALIADLGVAAKGDQFSLVYQPQKTAGDLRLEGVEALLRWRHPTRGLVSPDVFIPLAERSGIIGPITLWVLDRLMTETCGLSGVTVSFNASALEFADANFVDDLSGLMAKQGFNPGRLEIEITETALLADAPEVEANVSRLQALGVRTGLDDLGHCGAGLRHLRRLPFDTVKLDKALVVACDQDLTAGLLVEALVRLCHAKRARVVAEGVERPAQRDFLHAAGVDLLQGYLVGEPEPIGAFV